MRQHTGVFGALILGVLAQVPQARAQGRVESGAVKQAAQQQAPANEPEYLHTFFLLDSSTGALTPLERQPVEVESKANIWILTGKSSISIFGERSPVRFKEGRRLEFVVRASSQQVDPEGLVTLYLLDPDDGKRKLVMARSGWGSAASVGSEGAIPIKAAKYGTSSFRISPAQQLPPGEYVLSAGGDKVGFCFGVDEDPSYQAPPLDVRVQEDPHERARKTSSSVMSP